MTHAKVFEVRVLISAIYFDMDQKMIWGTSLAVQCLRLCASTAGGVGWIPGRGTKILRAGQHNQKKKKKKDVAWWIDRGIDG